MSEGTIEEKIDAMLESKRELAANVIGGGSEQWITDLSNVGTRLDEAPALFFQLRGIDVERFIDVALANKVEAMLANAQKPSGRILTEQDWETLFGVL